LKYGVASQWTSFVAVERKVEEEMEAEVEKREVERMEVEGDEEWDNVIEADRDGDDGDDDEMYSRSHGGPPAGKCSFSISSNRTDDLRVSALAMMMTAPPPPPPTPYPTKNRLFISSQYSGTPQKKFKSAAAPNTGTSDHYERGRERVTWSQQQQMKPSALMSQQSSSSPQTMYHLAGSSSAAPAFFTPAPPPPSGPIAGLATGAAFGASGSGSFVAKKMGLGSALSSVFGSQDERFQERYKSSGPVSILWHLHFGIYSLLMLRL
jgi:hypothetical protein